MKKSDLTSSLDTENFLKKIYDIRFFFLIDRDIPKIETPKYIILQYNKKGDWSDVYMYKEGVAIIHHVKSLGIAKPTYTIGYIPMDNEMIVDDLKNGLLVSICNL